MSNIIDFTGSTTHDLDPDKVLEEAKGELDCCVVIGWDKDDNLYGAVSIAKKAEILYLLEVLKNDLLNS